MQMVIQRSQQRFEVKALDIFVCSLETFLKVNERNAIFLHKSVAYIDYSFNLQFIQSAFSYFMVFRRLYAR